MGKENSMEFKGTQGNWKVVGTNITDSDGNSICSETGFWNFKEWDANAILIAKAPEMLKMLKQVNESLLNDSYSLEQMNLRQEVELLIKQATE